jgi:four helix bundle protein
MSESIRSFRELRVYQEAFDLQQEVFQLSKRWPSEEKYALTDQVRRSSRSVGANIAESWAKHAYPAHFSSKLTDADGELQETAHWLATAFACEYLNESQHSALQNQLSEIGGGLGKMISMPEKFVPKRR